MSDGKVKTFINLAVGFVVFTLFEGLQGIWNGEAIEFDADPDTVAEHAVLSGRKDLLPLLKHRRMVDVPGETVQVLKEVVYTPQGRPVFQDIPENETPMNAPIGVAKNPWESLHPLDFANPSVSGLQPVGFNAFMTEKPKGGAKVNAQSNKAEQSVEFVPSKSVDGTEATDAVELAEKTAEIAAAQEATEPETFPQPETKEPETEKSDKAKSKK